MKRQMPTPPPWEADRGTVHGFIVYGPEVDEYSTPGDLAVICEGATEANAHLIAAAPSLAIAARRALDHIEDCVIGANGVCADCLHWACVTVRELRAALAKAEGSR
jgi:hypothetical protein